MRVKTHHKSMKSMQLFFLSFFLFSICIIPFSSSAAKSPPPVLDADKNSVLTDGFYYIRPADIDSGAGVLAVDSINGYEICPLVIVQRIYELVDGLALTFSPAHHKKGTIRVSRDLNIRFAFPDSCNQSMVWKLEDYDESTGEYFVGIGGVAGHPGRRTVRNWFKIEKYENDYKLVFCPSVCKYCKVICKDIGIFIHHGKRRLALSDKPYKIIFRK